MTITRISVELRPLSSLGMEGEGADKRGDGDEGRGGGGEGGQRGGEGGERGEIEQLTRVFCLQADTKVGHIHTNNMYTLMHEYLEIYIHH